MTLCRLQRISSRFPLTVRLIGDLWCSQSAAGARIQHHMIPEDLTCIVLFPAGHSAAHRPSSAGSLAEGLKGPSWSSCITTTIEMVGADHAEALVFKPVSVEDEALSRTIPEEGFSWLPFEFDLRRLEKGLDESVDVQPNSRTFEDAERLHQHFLNLSSSSADSSTTNSGEDEQIGIEDLQECDTQDRDDHYRFSEMQRCWSPTDFSEW